MGPRRAPGRFGGWAAAHCLPYRMVPVPDRQAITRSDTGAVLGIFAGGYRIHQYEQWLLETVSAIVDSDLSVGSAGLLRGGAVAWVSVEVPDTITTPEGVAFRPHYWPPRPTTDR